MIELLLVMMAMPAMCEDNMIYAERPNGKIAHVCPDTAELLGWADITVKDYDSIPLDNPGRTDMGFGKILPVELPDSASADEEMPDGEISHTGTVHKYGPHPRDTFVLYRADGQSSPVMIYFHQGGSIDDVTYGEWHITTEQLIDSGISVIHADYPFVDETEIKGMVGNASLIVPYVMDNGAGLGLDPERIGVYGAGAGGGIALYIGTGEYSDEISVIGHFDAPSTFDLGGWPAIVDISLTDLIREGGNLVPPLYGAETLHDLVLGEKLKLRRSLDMLMMMDADDPPVVVLTDGVADGGRLGRIITHPGHSAAVLEKCTEQGLLCVDGSVEGMALFEERLMAGQSGHISG
ncbi:esterase/lipase [Cenarchaeum symbiosum A]|uniref:Esterase/lipase n=1 Tax=Cenarchaeum symbiosum (strain A) TaxID=414004 RepID=A0RWZ7_CENSY|nr:esterase/lipase [Cenarchaeum symbiosum A]